MGINKVNYGNTTLIDISSDTVSAGSMLDGVTAHDNSGTAVTGTIASKSSSDLTVNEATVTVPAGHYASQATKSVASGTAGTPTATKGTVSNHAISVTPSVTNTAGYISGGTKTGTAVSVSASELVSGNKAITANGTNINVTNYATVSVAVSGGYKKASVAGVVTDGSSLYFENIESSPTEFHMYVTAKTTSPYTPVNNNPVIFEVHYDGTETNGYYYNINNRTAIRAVATSGFTWSYGSNTLTINKTYAGGIFPVGIYTAITLYYK